MRFYRRSAIATLAIVAVIVVIVAAAGVGVYYVTTTSSPSSSSTTTTTTSASASTTQALSSTTSAQQTTTQPASTTTTPLSTTTASSQSATTSTSSSTSLATTYSTFSCTSTYSTGTITTVDYTPQYITTIKQFSAMEFRISGTYNGTMSNSTISYHVTSSSGGIYSVNITESAAGNDLAYLYKIDSNNNSVLSATISVSGYNYTFTGSQAKADFDGTFALFGLEYTYGGALGLYTSSNYFHSTGTTSMTFGTTTFPVTTYIANNVPETINDCGVTSTLTAYTLGVGTPPGTSLQFITYLHVAGTSSSSNGTFDDTFQLVSMTVG